MPSSSGSAGSVSAPRASRLGQNQRAQPVARDHAGGRCAEIVVEHLQRQRPRVAAGQYRRARSRRPADRPGRGSCGNAGSRTARPWTAAARRPAARRRCARRAISASAGGIVVQREGMEAVHDQAQRRMSGLLHDPPGMAATVARAGPSSAPRSRPAVRDAPRAPPSRQDPPRHAHRRRSWPDACCCTPARDRCRVPA